MVFSGVPMPWFFYDHYKILKTYHDAMYATIALSSQPSLGEEDRQAYQDTLDKLSTQKVSYLRNPGGSLLFFVVVPNLTRFIDIPARTKANVTEFIDAVESLE